MIDNTLFLKYLLIYVLLVNFNIIGPFLTSCETMIHHLTLTAFASVHKTNLKIFLFQKII